jgi:hypothetical protein
VCVKARGRRSFSLGPEFVPKFRASPAELLASKAELFPGIMHFTAKILLGSADVFPNLLTGSPGVFPRIPALPRIPGFPTGGDEEEGDNREEQQDLDGDQQELHEIASKGRIQIRVRRGGSSEFANLVPATPSGLRGLT